MFMLPVIGVVSLERARETEGEKKRSLVRRSEEKEGKREREKEREKKRKERRGSVARLVLSLEHTLVQVNHHY